MVFIRKFIAFKVLSSIEILLWTFFVFVNYEISIDVGLKISKNLDIAKDDKGISIEILLLKEQIRS